MPDSKKSYKGSSRRLLNYGYVVLGTLVLLSMILSLVIVGGGGGGGGKSQPEATPIPPTPIPVAELHLAGAPTRGQADAPITLVHFGDFQSTGDKTFEATIEKQMEQEFFPRGDLRIVWKDFPNVGSLAVPTPGAAASQDESFLAAQAARCAGEQQKFWEYHDALFTNQGAPNSGVFAKDKLVKYAVGLGLDTAKFSECLSSGKFAQAIKNDLADAGKAGVITAPGFLIVVGNFVLPVPSGVSFDSLSPVIRNLITQLKSPPPPSLTPTVTPTPRVGTPLPEATSVPPRPPTPTPEFIGPTPKPVTTPAR